MGKAVNPFIPLYRTCDTGTNEEKYQLLKDGKLTVPRYLDVELTNLCNFQCCFCPTGTHSMKRTKGMMPESVMERLLEDVRKHQIPGVRVIGWGEPTLHPHWMEFLHDVKSGGALVHLGTNGSRLSDEEMQQLIDMGVDSIKFSFQGADAASYGEMREGGDYHQLVETVQTMHRLRGDKLLPFIQISTTLTVESPEQVTAFRKEIEQYCDYCNIGYTMLNHLSVDAMDVSAEKREKIRKMQEQEAVHHVYRTVCSDAFDKLDIHWNGDAVLCCSDYDNFMVVGNILDQDVTDIFQSRIAGLYRDMIVKGEYGRIQCCSTCWETVPLTK